MLKRLPTKVFPLLVPLPEWRRQKRNHRQRWRWQRLRLRRVSFPEPLHKLRNPLLYFDLRKYDEAGALFDRAATIKEHLLDKDDPDVADALIKVACASLARGYYAEAESPSQRALSILEKSSPPNYTALIQALTNYAVVLEKTKRKAEAELLETRAMVYRAKLKNSKSKGEAVLSAKQP